MVCQYYNLTIIHTYIENISIHHKDHYKMSRLVLLICLISHSSLVNINTSSSVYTHIRMLDDDDDDDNSDDEVNDNSDSDNECGILHCDDCSSNTCNECDNGFYLSSTNTECIPCEDTHCNRCVGGGINTCTKCKDKYIAYDYSCINTNDFPRERIISECEAYNIDYKCILCDDDCTLETNGKCNCKKSNNAVVITSVVITVAIVLAIVIFVMLYFKRKKRNKATTTTSKTTPVQVVPIQNKDEKDHSINNNYNTCEPQPAIMDHNRGSSSELVCSSGIDNDIKVLCCECNKEYAMYELSCGCCFCVNHVGCFKEFPCEKNKCRKCNNEVVNVDKLGSMCNVCLDICKGLVRFDCGCQFEVCGKCFNKCIKEQKCPGCRRNVSNNPITIYS